MREFGLRSKPQPKRDGGEACTVLPVGHTPSVFGLGSLEILVILGLALVVLGPRRLPEVASTLGKAYGAIRRTTYELRTTLDREIREEERVLRREKAVARRAELESMRLQREDEARDRLAGAPDGPLVAESETAAVTETPADPESSESP